MPAQPARSARSAPPARHSQSPLRGGSRSRRVALTVAAVSAVVLFPTAVDLALAGTVDSVQTESATAGPETASEHAGHGGAPVVSDPEPDESPEPEETEDAAPAEEPAAAPAGLDVLGDDCSTSDLEPHEGFQEAPRCVAIAFGEVAAAERSPSLLITEAPTEVGSDEAFTLEVSTRNLVRDRFLGAADGGYYRESSFLDEDGVQRGHFHTACRMLPSLDEAPDAAPAPAFFLATQDGGGGAEPDRVTVEVPGLPESGTAQCAVWAGDGSHRVPMMERANQTPAFDIVRITVG